MLGHYSEITKNNRECVADALMDIAQCDADFCGDNGDYYLWEVAEGFESNAEYCLSVAEKESTITKMIMKFVSMWMDYDSYYEKYDVDIKEMNDIISISIAFITD